MKNESLWHETKYELKAGELRASRNERFLSPASWCLADAVAELYNDALPRYASGRLADLGCGAVPLFGTYRSYVREVTCIDWPHSLHGLDFLDIHCDISKALPVEASAFDTVILSDVLEHIADPRTLWSEIHRVLAPGGHLIMNVPFLYWIHEAPHDYYRYTEFALRRHAETFGFEVLELRPVGGSLEVFVDLIGKHLIQIPKIGRILTRMLASLGRLVGRTSLGIRLKHRSSSRFPIGYFMIARRQA